MAYSHRSNSTHLISAEAAAVLRAACTNALQVVEGDPVSGTVSALARFGLLVEVS